MNNWEHLRYFVAVADHGSVASAAREAGVSHATVLRAIQRLEDDLGIRLFDHLRSGYRLTPEGSELLPHAHQMAKEAASLNRKAKGQGAIPAGELGVSIPDPSIVDLLPLLAAFRSAYPNVDVNLRSTPSPLPGGMLDHDVRLVFLLTNSPPDELVGRKLGNLNFALCRGADAVDCWIDWSDDPAGMLDRELFLQVQLGVDARQTMTVQRHAEAIHAVSAGIGTALIAEAAAHGGGLQIAGRGPDVGLWMLTHPEFRNDGRVRAMMAYCSSRYESM